MKVYKEIIDKKNILKLMKAMKKMTKTIKHDFFYFIFIEDCIFINIK